jgi:hypothetical protein
MADRVEIRKERRKCGFCVHEAAHAVEALCSGYDIGEEGVWVDADTGRGYTDIKSPITSFADCVRSVYVGPVAEAYFFSEPTYA